MEHIEGCQRIRTMGAIGRKTDFSSEELEWIEKNFALCFCARLELREGGWMPAYVDYEKLVMSPITAIFARRRQQLNIQRSHQSGSIKGEKSSMTILDEEGSGTVIQVDFRNRKKRD